MMITVVLMLYTTITTIIHIVGLKNDHRLITTEEEEEKNEEEKNEKIKKEKEKMSNEN